MRKTLLAISKFLMKHMWLYYLLNCTWGIVMTFIGMLAYVVIMPFANHERYACALRLRTGETWGGLSIGMTLIICKESDERLQMHEVGHTFQNAIFGPFMLFVVTIPSAIRYWVRRYVTDVKHAELKTAYDDIWFEGSATEIGAAFAEANYAND